LERSNKLKLQVVFEKDETGYFVAEVPGMPGCFSQGKTMSELEVNIKEAMVGWIEVMNEKAIEMKKDGLLEVAI
jgi:predicted RNase H-like HicB family nuclease